MTDLRTVVDNTKPKTEQPTLLEAARMTLDVLEEFGGLFGRAPFPERLLQAEDALRNALRGTVECKVQGARLSTLPEAIHQTVLRTQQERAVAQADGHSDAIDQAERETQIFGGPEIKTPCPSCGFTTLFVGTGGHLTCGVAGCKQPAVEFAVEALTKRAEAAEKETRGTQLSLGLLRVLFSHPHVSDTERLATARDLLAAIAPTEPAGR